MVKICINKQSVHILNLCANLLGQDSAVADIQRVARGWMVHRIISQWGARFYAPIQSGPGVHPAFCTMGTGSLLCGSSGWGVVLTTHPDLAPKLKKEYSYTSTPLLGLLYEELYLYFTFMCKSIFKKLQLHHCHLIISQFLQLNVMYLVLCVYLSSSCERVEMCHSASVKCHCKRRQCFCCCQKSAKKTTQFQVCLHNALTFTLPCNTSKSIPFVSMGTASPQCK